MGNQVSLLITKGSTPTTYGHEFVEQSENSIRFVGAYNCSFDGKFKSDSEKWISKEADELLKRSKLNEKDCIICIVGNTIGSNFLVSKEIIPANINQNVAIIRADERKVNSRYLHYWIMSPYIQYQVQQEASTQAQPSLSLKQVGDFTIALPPLNEQNRIAKILSTWDKAISTTEQLLANSQQQKKALMQQLLSGKKRLLDNNGVRFSGEWQQCIIEDFFDVGSSKRVLQDDWKNEGTPFYRTRELVSLSKNEPFRSEVFIADELFHELSIKYGAPKPGDFLVSGVGTLGISYQVKDGDKFYFKDGNVLWFKIREGLFSDYFKYCFQLDFLQEQIVAQASITTVGTYTIQNAKKTKFWCPPSIAEQQKIAAVLSTADQEIAALQQKLDALKQEKMALMQQLLTGKRRVKVEEA
ncbi:restriction endonuclease subunit S [Aeromonas caviae]|uniref:restriction endonuclease subunit S n=1 Tax=Aeromonas caviae TaxID=648 RepID=UPI00375460F8